MQSSFSPNPKKYYRYDDESDSRTFSGFSNSSTPSASPAQPTGVETTQLWGPYDRSLFRTAKPKHSKFVMRNGPTFAIQIVSDLHLELYQKVFELPDLPNDEYSDANASSSSFSFEEDEDLSSSSSSSSEMDGGGSSSFTSFRNNSHTPRSRGRQKHARQGHHHPSPHYGTEDEGGHVNSSDYSIGSPQKGKNSDEEGEDLASSPHYHFTLPAQFPRSHYALPSDLSSPNNNNDDSPQKKQDDQSIYSDNHSISSLLRLPTTTSFGNVSRTTDDDGDTSLLDHLGNEEESGADELNDTTLSSYSTFNHSSFVDRIPYFNRKSAEDLFQQLIVTEPKKANFLALLGDIGNPEFEAYGFFLSWCAKRFELVFVLPGDKEGYGIDRPWSETIAMIQRACEEAGPNVAFCHKYSMDIQGFRILATTLWSHIDPAHAEDCSASIRHISVVDPKSREIRKATIEDTNAWHQEEVEWLRKELRENPDVPTLVLTHHAPLMCCLDPETHPTHPEAQAFCSQLDDLFQDPVIGWAYGHTHFPMDFRVGTAHVISNPAGYHRCEYPTPNGRPYRPNLVIQF